MKAQISVQKWFYLIALSLIWGSSYVLIKKGLEHFSYMNAASIRLLMAAVVCLPPGLYYISKVPAGKAPFILLSGLLGMFIPAYLFCLSQQHIQSSVAGILIAMTPSFTFIFSVFLYKKPYTKIQLSGLLLGLLCCISLSIHSSSGAIFSINKYVFFIIIATICYGANINLVKQYLADIPSIQISTLSVSANGFLALGLLFSSGSTISVQWEEGYFSSLVALLVLGILGTALAQFLHNKLISISSSLFASTTTYLIPVVAISWGIVEKETLTPIHFIASIGIIGSVYMIRTEKPQRVPNQENRKWIQS